MILSLLVFQNAPFFFVKEVARAYSSNFPLRHCKSGWFQISATHVARVNSFTRHEVFLVDTCNKLVLYQLLSRYIKPDIKETALTGGKPVYIDILVVISKNFTKFSLPVAD